MGEFRSRELTIGQCDPASDAFFVISNYLSSPNVLLVDSP